MALILNIDTATPHASVCISRDGQLLGIESSPQQKDHAAFLQPAIARLLAANDLQLSMIDAVAVSNGPGSYTGLRVGLSSAKGICYALNKPLLLLNTLQVIAAAAMRISDEDNDALFCPMIDARRMEVFTAVYNRQWEVVVQPCAMVIDETSFEGLAAGRELVLCGDGASKSSDIIKRPRTTIVGSQHNATDMQQFSEQKFKQNDFADLAYSEPFYLKEFFTTAVKLKSD